MLAALLAAAISGANQGSAASALDGTVDLSLVKLVDGTKSRSTDAGRNVTFTIIVKNAGPAVATGVRVSDRLPSGYRFVSANVSQGSYDEVSGDWNIGTIPRDGSAGLAVVAILQPTGAYVNVAEVTAVDQQDVDSTPNNRSPNDDDQDQAQASPLRGGASAASAADPAAATPTTVPLHTIAPSPSPAATRPPSPTATAQRPAATAGAQAQQVQPTAAPAVPTRPSTTVASPTATPRPANVAPTPAAATVPPPAALPAGPLPDAPDAGTGRITRPTNLVGIILVGLLAAAAAAWCLSRRERADPAEDPASGMLQ